MRTMAALLLAGGFMLITSFPSTLAFRLPLSNKGQPHNT